jgi:hypothetical protein
VKVGNRAYIQLESKAWSTPIVFYGHYSGTDNLEAVQNVLARTHRIGDPSYLAAQLFYEFSKLGMYDGDLGFGISPDALDGTEWTDQPSVFVNLDTGDYEFAGVTYLQPLRQPHSVSQP